MSLSRRRLLMAGLLLSLRDAYARSRDGAMGLPRSGPRIPRTASSDFRDAWNRETQGAAESISDEIDLTIPSVAEDGAFVPVTLRSRIGQTQRAVLFVERNPFPLIAAFDFAESAVPVASLNIKMNGSSTVLVLVRAGGRFYRTERYVRVVRGGCGDSPDQPGTNR